MPKFLRELYGVGVLFFYYVKYFILFGLPVLYFGLDYRRNIILDILWIICLGLMVKDMVMMWKKRG